MVDIVNLYKNKGETPLEALERLRIFRPEYKDVALSYAGRLDPMAEGVMLVLVGEANKKREDYLGLKKEYTVEVLFGVETDTYDVLGIVSHPLHVSHVDPLSIREGMPGVARAVGGVIGTFQQPYPPYSSKPVNGKPLFQWARDGALDEIEILTKEVTIYACDILKEYLITHRELGERVKRDISLVKGDFRQADVLTSWITFLDSLPLDTKFHCAEINVRCSSGTYMRSLAHMLGKELGMGAIALTIRRTKVGEYSIEDSLRDF